VLPRLAYLTLCRSIQLLALLADDDAAKDLGILVPRHQLAVLRRQIPRLGLEPADRACSPRSAASCPQPAGVGCRNPFMQVASGTRRAALQGGRGDASALDPC
jgi:hypothetical protein